ncbi:MAG TPA: class I SAM-dependent methyltransferase [Candidatus Pristimantibacillus sp.]|nr:class I SAM-dependent methyltransferase [Candidatus Pristimantibacillus sp.]
MSQTGFWHDPAVAEAYARLAASPDDAWYEREVNRPSIAGLIPADARPILDVGCGPGLSTAKLAETFPDVEGTDESEAMLAVARRLHPDLHFSLWQANPEPSEMNKYGAAVCARVIECIQEDEELAVFLGGLRQRLRPGGTLVVSTHHPVQSARATQNYAETAPYQTADPKYGIAPRLVHRSLETLVGAFKAAGFVLSLITEPQPTDEQLARHATGPNLFATPQRLNMRFQKPN